MHHLKPTLFLFLFAIAISVKAQIPANQPAPKGFSKADISAVDSVVNAFMQKYRVPGLSFAMTKGDSLKLQRTYGYADSVKKEPVTIDSRFRIASVSKSFTSAGIMLLIEQGKLHLNDKVFGEGSVFGNMYGKQPYKEGVTEITIQQLLEHTAGGWGNSGQDPMFMHGNMSQAELINWVLDNMKLNNKPGTNYSYSNFGYCLLGRVIEKISGMPYEKFMQKNILQKSGIKTMETGGNTLAQRKHNEVFYHDHGDYAYTMNVSRMDAHGGWIATATDLVKFLTKVNYTPRRPELLKPATLNQMYTVTLPGSNYAKGWAVNSANNHWHNGSLPGEQSFAVNTGTGFSWAVLVNTRTGGNFGGDLDRLMWQIKEAVKVWPDVDLFEK